MKRQPGTRVYGGRTRTRGAASIFKSEHTTSTALELVWLFFFVGLRLRHGLRMGRGFVDNVDYLVNGATKHQRHVNTLRWHAPYTVGGPKFAVGVRIRRTQRRGAIGRGRVQGGADTLMQVQSVS
jgi:hypothetical protein